MAGFYGSHHFLDGRLDEAVPGVDTIKPVE